MTRKATQKRSLILQGAVNVFVRKGYNAATMQDIVEECGISRGGLYLYFDSTEAIFLALLTENSQSMEQEFEQMMSEGLSFRDMMEHFLNEQKTELLQADNSMMAATYEFFLAHKNDQDKSFLQQQFELSVSSLTKALEYGVTRNEVHINNIEQVVRHIILTIEGMRIYALSVGISQHMLDEQIEMLKSLLFTPSLDLE